MFERFTAESREVVVAARRHAESFGHRQVNTEHLLLALVEQGDVTSRVLTEAGLTPSLLNESLGIDRTALEFLGIDLEQVLARTREMFPNEVARSSLKGVHFAAETKKGPRDLPARSDSTQRPPHRNRARPAWDSEKP